MLDTRHSPLGGVSVLPQLEVGEKVGSGVLWISRVYEQAHAVVYVKTKTAVQTARQQVVQKDLTKWVKNG